MFDLIHQLYKAKLRFAGLITAVVGIGLLVVGRAAVATPTLSWLVGWPAEQVGTTLLTAGVVAVIFEYYARKEAEALTAERLRRAIRQEAPAIRDAVLDSLAFDADVLKDVASPDSLDRIAVNAIGLRTGDPALAQDAYADLRDQVIRSPERWRDVDVSVTLSKASVGPAVGHGSLFEAIVRWEYRTTSPSSVLRFACTSDAAEYRELLRDPTVTAPWFADQSGGVDASSRDIFEVVQVTVDDKPRPVRRASRRGAQLYTSSLGTIPEGADVRVAYTYRVLVQRHGHVLYLDLPRPAKGLHVRLDYAGAGIRRINTLDFIASTQVARIDQSPSQSIAKTVNVGFDGWTFPRSGVAFVWVLNDELERTG